MKTITHAFIYAVLLGIIGYLWLNTGKADKTSQCAAPKDTIVVYDTVPVVTPVPKDSVVLRYEIAKLPYLFIKRDTVYLPTPDKDSVLVEIPITQKEYRDSAYQAWVSGYKPNLDSIYIYRPTRTVMVKHYEDKRWGLGVQVGAGITTQGVQPYIGVGVHYNIFSW